MQPADDRLRLPCRRRADVAALRVDDQRQILGELIADPLQRPHAVPAERLEEREVRLDRGGERGRGLDQEPGERFGAAKVRAEPGGQVRRIRVEAEAEHGARRRRPRPEPLEVAAGHGAVGAVDEPAAPVAPDAPLAPVAPEAAGVVAVGAGVVS